MPRVIRRCAPRVIRERGPYNAPLFNLPILPEQNGRVKNNLFFETEVTFLRSLGHMASGGEERGEHL